LRYIGACLGTPEPWHPGTSSSKKVENAWIRKDANAYAHDELEKMPWMHIYAYEMQWLMRGKGWHDSIS